MGKKEEEILVNPNDVYVRNISFIPLVDKLENIKWMHARDYPF
jgi:hypothetical protein